MLKEELLKVEPTFMQRRANEANGANGLVKSLNLQSLRKQSN